MISRTITLNPVEPAFLSLRTALGVGLDLELTFRNQHDAPVNPDTLLPQIVLLPRSRGGMFPYPVETTSPEAGTAAVSVPSTVLVDRSGYTLELYSRRVAENPDDPPVATGLIAKGVVALDGEAFQRWGPLGMVNVPVIVGPPGPTGPQGEQGIQGETGPRGSIWTSGPGAPVVTGTEEASDMYLDETSGDVWRFEAGVGWVLT